MRVQKRSSKILALRDRPGCFWLFGFFFIALGGMILAGLLGLFTNLKEVSLLDRALASVLSVAIIGVGVYVVYRSPGSHVVFDHDKDSVIIVRKGLMRRQKIAYPIHDVAEVFLEDREDIDGGLVHRVAVRLQSGKEVELSSLWVHDKNELDRVVAAIREFLSDRAKQ